MAAVDEVDGLLLREVRVGDDHLVEAVLGEDRLDLLERAEGAQAVVGPRGQRDEAHDGDPGVIRGVEHRVRDRLDVLPGAHEHRPPLVARRLEHGPGDLLVGPARGRDVEDGEEQRPVEDVVARERLAVDEREDEGDHRRLEERADDAGEARAG